MRQPAVGDARAHVPSCEPETPQQIDGRGDELRIGQRSGLADEVHVDLVVLPQPAPLLTLVAVHLPDREPADRLLERPRPGRHHARQRGRHLRPQRDLPPALVLEVVELLDDLRTALLDVQLQRLERGPVVLLEAVARGDAAPDSKYVIAESRFVGIEIPESGQ